MLLIIEKNRCLLYWCSIARPNNAQAMKHRALSEMIANTMLSYAILETHFIVNTIIPFASFTIMKKGKRSC